MHNGKGMKNLTDSFAMIGNMKARSSLHLARKIWHMGVGLVGLYMYSTSIWSSREWGQGLLLIAVLAFALEFFRLRWPLVNKLFCYFASHLMRRSELNSPTGLGYYALGVGASFLFFDPQVALLGCCYLFFADPIASWVGVMAGKTKLWSGRTLEGTLAFFNVALILNIIFLAAGAFYGVKHLTLFCFFCATLGATSELLSVKKWLDDNLTIPLLSGLAITLVEKLTS